VKSRLVERGPYHSMLLVLMLHGAKEGESLNAAREAEEANWPSCAAFFARLVHFSTLFLHHVYTALFPAPSCVL
jgi:hypothetical protein